MTWTIYEGSDTTGNVVVEVADDKLGDILSNEGLLDGTHAIGLVGTGRPRPPEPCHNELELDAPVEPLHVSLSKNYCPARIGLWVEPQALQPYTTYFCKHDSGAEVVLTVGRRRRLQPHFIGNAYWA